MLFLRWITAGIRSWRYPAALTLLGGAANLVILWVLNLDTPPGAGGWLALCFVGAAVVSLWANFQVRCAFITAVQGTIAETRIRVADRLRRAELLALDHVRAAEIQDRMAGELALIGQLATSVTWVLVVLPFLVGASVYLFAVSPPAFATFLFFMLGAGRLVFLNTPLLALQTREAGKLRVAHLEGVTDLLAGAKEVRLNRACRDDLQAELTETADSLWTAEIAARRSTDRNDALTRLWQYAGVASVVFIVPQYFASAPATIQQTLTTSLFLLLGLGFLTRSYPRLVRADVVLANIAALEAQLASATRSTADPRSCDTWTGMSPLVARGVSFRYPGDGDGRGFVVGPVDLQVAPGEVVMFIGGNGSGKSTCLRVLSGLYRADGGELSLGGVVIDDTNIEAYRERISAVFSDFHLFRRLHGYGDLDHQRADALLHDLKLAHAVDLRPGRFAHHALSTGQRRRLALALALLEDRPIYVFDEWASDQDPEFRRYFYEELLPELRRRGKIVLAATHDERYFGVADQVVTMARGAVVP